MKIERLQAILDSFSNLRMRVIGDVILDHYIWGDVGRISPEAPVPLLDVKEESHRLGGAANVALNLSAMGVQTGLFGRVGNDVGGEQLKEMLDLASIEWMGSNVPYAERTIVKSRIVARNQQLCRLDREDRRSNYALKVKEWEEYLDVLLHETMGVVLSDYAKGVIDDSLLSLLKKRAEKLGVPVFCDPKPRISRDFSKMKLLTPNVAEALEMSQVEWDRKDPLPMEAIVRSIHQRFEPQYLVITLGAEGMLYAENGQIGGIIPTYAREVYDVSGAGDTVIAVLSAALLSGATLEESVTVANLAAGVVVSKLGTAAASVDEITEYGSSHLLDVEG